MHIRNLIFMSTSMDKQISINFAVDVNFLKRVDFLEKLK